LNIKVTGHVGPQVKLPAALAARQQIEHMDEFIDMLLPDTSYNYGQSVSDMNLWRKNAWATVPLCFEGGKAPYCRLSTVSRVHLQYPMRAVYLKTLLIACLTGFMPYCLPAQEQQPDAVFLKEVLPAIEARWEQPGGDTAIYFILEQVRHFCGEDDNCLAQAYGAIMSKLEQRSYLPLAIFVGEEVLKSARRQGDLHTEASTYVHLERFHNALGNDRLAILNLQNALRLYEQLGKQSKITRIKLSLSEYGLRYRNKEDVLLEMEALLAQAIKNKDTVNINYMHLRLSMLTHEIGQYGKMEEHIVALEKIPLSNPIKPKEYGYAIHAALGRAALLKIQEKFEEAERYYQKALRLCEAEPSRWLEIQTLQSLADLEWERGNSAIAKSYLDNAQAKAEKLNFDNLLVFNYERKAKIAEAEGRFADALRFIKKQQFHKGKFEARNAGFNMENYNLQREKEQLAIEKKNQELELQIRKNQLRTTLVITALALALAGLLFTGLRRQRKAKQELAAQNTLIQRQAGELKSLDVAKSRFFANVSHELRTPLTLILGPLRSVLKSGTLDHRNTTLLKMARQSGEDLLKLVGSLLDLSKLEHDKMVLQENPEHIYPLMQRIVSTFDSHAGYLGIRLAFSYRAEKDLQLELDREKLEIILNNLLSNAFKFTDKGGEVEVLVEDRGNTFLISVRDTGRGISPTDLPHVFDRFYQSKEKNIPAEGGTGIGLALCRELIALMRGNIRAESIPGSGSTFFVELPKKEVLIEPLTEGVISDNIQSTVWETSFPFPAAPDDHPLNAHNSSLITHNLSFITPPSKTTILVVEDNRSLSDYLYTILSPYYQVMTAGNGQEALELLRNAAPKNRERSFPSLLLSDLMMPVMDGYQLLEELKGNDATWHIPVIMLTARADARDKLKALRVGVDDYLTKPFDEEELLVRIENLLQNRTARQDAVAETVTQIEPAPPALSSADAAWLEQFEAFVRKNLGNDILAVPMLAHEFAMSESTLLRQLKRLTGFSPMQYLQEIRLDEARRLLDNRTSDSIAQVASKVGYGEVRFFSRIFKQRFGKSPSEYISI